MNTNFYLAKKFIERKRLDGHESLSGPGSHLSNTKESIDFISKVILDCNINSILDLGCGDWNWFKKVNTASATYTGWDACEEMINDNNKFYGCKNIKFETKDIVTEPYPTVDLIICRDVLFHMTIDISTKVLDKIKLDAKYFICTSFNDVNENKPHKNGWGFYKINTNIKPFNLQKCLLKSERELNNNHSGHHRYINLYKFQ